VRTVIFLLGTIVTMALPAAATALIAHESTARHSNLAQQVSAAPSESQPGAQRLLEVPQTLGPFSFAGQTFSVVLRQKFLSGSPDPKFAQSLASLEIHDATGAVLYQKAFPYNIKEGRFTCPVTAFAQLLVGIGDTWVVESRKIGTKWWLPSYTALLISYTGVPTDNASESAVEPNGQAWQVFGIKDGKLQLLSAPNTHEMMMGNSAPYAIVQGSGGAVSAVPIAPSSDIFNVRVWTGNFYVFVPLQVHWDTGKLALGMRCFVPYRREAGCDMRVEAQRIPSTAENSFLRLFPSGDPDPGEPLHIVLDKNSQAQILKANAFVDWTESGDMLRVGFRDLWLKVRVNDDDRKEGWIQGPDDFAAAGWPSNVSDP
jgi:hypothetical protein